MGTHILSICYLIASVTFTGSKMLSDPASARKGNLIAAAGMAIAVLATILLYRKGNDPLHNRGLDDPRARHRRRRRRHRRP